MPDSAVPAAERPDDLWLLGGDLPPRAGESEPFGGGQSDQQAAEQVDHADQQASDERPYVVPTAAGDGRVAEVSAANQPHLPVGTGPVPGRDGSGTPGPSASAFAAGRSAAAEEPPTLGMPALLHRATGGHVRLRPTRAERARRDVESDIRRGLTGLRQVTFTNPKGGSGKTTAALLTSMTLGQLRGGYVLAWDNNETQGTLGVRARPDAHSHTVRDLVDDLLAFSGPVPGRVGELAKYVRSQGDAMFDVLASDEQATAGEMMTAAAFSAVREVVARFYKILCVDTGNNVRAANWTAAIESTDLLVVTSSVRWESAYSASRMLDYLEQSGHGELVANAVTVLTMPQKGRGLSHLAQVETHFALRTRAVLHAPFDPQLDHGDQIRFTELSGATRQAWQEIAAAVVRGL